MGSKLQHLLEEIRISESNLKKYMDRKENAQEKIDELLDASFGELKDFIAKKVVENMSEEDQKGVAERQAKREAENRAFLESLGKKKKKDLQRITDISTEHVCDTISYSMERFFNPYVDHFIITDYTLNEDSTKIKLTVECVKNRGYLGITGCWFPDLHSTDWISIKELEEIEKNL
jgi:hypothetical protein